MTSKKKLNEKIILIGAGSSCFTRGLISDVIRKGWTGEITLVDIDAKVLSLMERLARKMLDEGNSTVKLSASTDRRQVLKGATAVICTIAVGGRDAWFQDVAIPRKYGIYQPVGDTAMPGGTSRALRMIPAMVDIARDVMDLAPNALFFNYANPMNVICRAVRKETGANMIGLCHGVFCTAGRLAGLLKTTKDKLNYTAVGFNHFTWFTNILVDGKDAMPELINIATKKLSDGVDTKKLGTFFEEAGDSKEDIGLSLTTPFTFELTRLFGAFPCVLDRHIVEFFPHMFSSEKAYFGKTLGVNAYSVERTIEEGEATYEEAKSIALSDAPLPESIMQEMAGEHEQVCDIIESIRNDSGARFSANLPNNGQIPNLPEDAIVEGPAIATAQGLQPVMTSPLSAAILGTLANRFQWAELTVEAALEGSRDKFVQALLIDGSVKSVETAYRLADELLEAHKEHLPQFIFDDKP
jgi:alpha-galactosidase